MLISYLLITFIISIICFGGNLFSLIDIFKPSSYTKKNRIKATLGLSLIAFVLFTVLTIITPDVGPLFLKGVSDTIPYNPNAQSSMIIFSDIVNSAFTTFILIFTYITYKPSKS